MCTRLWSFLITLKGRNAHRDVSIYGPCKSLRKLHLVCFQQLIDKSISNKWEKFAVKVAVKFLGGELEDGIFGSSISGRIENAVVARCGVHVQGTGSDSKKGKNGKCYSTALNNFCPLSQRKPS